ncbi:11116_t:CDS:2 [Dentiscutata heterogama]|uniref:11116_t:CDS:1 n=1 Tax=Dentiscutata heterogama TaxID=1316150 RepID=A0ACA9MJN2_9GLOM|nr:11116_t:CDS:2 [Dentiscutata heterogama]
MSGEPPKQTAINIPPDAPGASAQTGAIASEGDKGQDNGGKGAGETVKDTLELLDSVPVIEHAKDKVEDELEKIDPDTPAERSVETANITARINKLDVVITIGLYYASLITDWLTSLGSSTSVGAFFYNIFFASFDLTQWKFGQLDLVASISGMTTTLQSGIFVIAASVHAIATVTKTKVPKQLEGPLYFGGPFQFVHLIKTEYNDYHQSTKSWDAQVSQGIGIISQILIIAAAICAASTRMGQLGALQPLATGEPNVINANFTPPHGTEIEGEPINVANQTQVTLAVQNAALFATTTYIVSVFAIIMSSMLNVIQWLADVWRVNNDELIIYYLFKYCTRIVCCYPCLVLIRGKAKVDAMETGTATNSEKANPSLQSPFIP